MRRIFSRSILCSLFSAALAHAAEVNEFARAAYWDRIFEYAWSVYFILFGIAALGAILAVLAGRRRFYVLFSLSFAALLILCAISIQTGIDQKRGFIADQEKHYAAA